MSQNVATVERFARLKLIWIGRFVEENVLCLVTFCVLLRAFAAAKVELDECHPEVFKIVC